MKTYYVYIITNKHNTTLYIGITNDLQRRMYEHKNKCNKGFSQKYNLTKLIYFEDYDDIYSAIEREKQLKRWHREWKENLIKEHNLSWQDLSASWDVPQTGDAEINSA